MSDPIDKRLELAIEIAREAGDLILRHYQHPDLSIEMKADATPVTIADREAESLLRERIEDCFPDDGLLGEELGDQPGTSGYRWILDPIDGTKSFMHGVPLFGTLIGVIKEGRAEIGVCRLPALQEVVYAATGRGCWWQQCEAEPRPARVTATPHLSNALLCYTSTGYFEQAGELPLFDALRKACRRSRGWGDCYGHVLVATGRADLIVEAALQPWDAAGFVAIMREAGGHFVDWSGRESFDSGGGMSVNATLLPEVLELIRMHARSDGQASRT